ncbi:MAG: molecular chaperone GrpE [Parcubacteria bacterium C7867-008]|nr:MAG: molecular chaperone GrpE [Parcubacteria bacterium C7867-008]
MNDDDVVIEQDGLEETGMSEEELEATESRVDAKATKLKKELDACKVERQEYMDGWQRAKADYVNALKRFEDEKKALVSRGVVKSVETFLPAMDSLARAEAAGEIPDAFQGIAKQLHDAAKSLGMEQFGSIGDAFDHNLHEALGQDAASTKEEDETVSAVLEKGWKTTESVIRPAKVRVAQFEG